MEHNEILKNLKDILVQMDPSKKELMASVTEETKLSEDLGLTSVALIYMVVAIEETFEIEFDDLSIDDFKTVGTTIKYIENKL
ncbi:MAG: acyl carrier protein [Bacilli bacterium]|nr:acyl carrier protein [Bacilli bacterium]